MAPLPQQIDGRSIDCPAKLNLTLAVGMPRPDGYHPIASVMVAVDFCDLLTVKPIERGPSGYAREWASDRYGLGDADTPSQPIDWPIERDLIYKAHRLIEQEAGRALPIACKLHKRIPAGAGLGGGSSDAAGMLVVLRDVFELSIADDRLIELGGSLGADVGFAAHALLGRRAAVVTGIGELVTPLLRLPAFDAVLIFMPTPCPTAEVYAAFDADPHSARDAHALQAMADQWRDLDGLPEPMNDLTAAARTVTPQLAGTMDTLHESGHAAQLTGSGSTLFVLADSPRHAQQIASETSRAGLPSLATRFQP